MRAFRRDHVAIDSNLLLLLIVGVSNPRLISIHKRLSGYTIDDFVLVREFVSSFRTVVATAHVLTEVSNLVGFATGEWQRLVQQQLARTITQLDEQVIPSHVASVRSEFLLFGLTDAALSELCLKLPLLTQDERLAAYLRRKGVEVVTLETLRGLRDRANNAY